MEDQIVEWRIVEHTSLEEEEEEEEDEREVKESKMRWIVNKGLGFGKKVMIIGFVITSAPVVLPPLFVISALGFAFSVPFGLAFAGYTCTEKLMNKLLPRSEAPLLLEYGEMYGDEEELDEQFGGKGPDFGGEMVMEEEEKKEMQDAKEGVEMRIQFVMDDSRGYEQEPTLVGDLDFGRAEEEREINVDEGGKEEGYEEDVGEYLEVENDRPMKEMNLETVRGRGAENWEFDEKIKRTEGLDLVAREAMGENEGEKDVTLTPGLPETNLVEVYVRDAVKEDNRSLENLVGLEGKEEGKDTRGPEIVEKLLESKDEKERSVVREIQGAKTETPAVTSVEKVSVEVTKKPNSSKISKKHQKKKKGNEEKNAATSERGEGLSNKQQEDNGIKMIKVMEDVKDEGNVKQDEKHLLAKRETKEGRDEVNQSGATKNAQKAAEMDKALPGNRDARHGRDVGQATKPTKNHKGVSNGKNAPKDVSGPLGDKDTMAVEKEAQRKAPDVHGIHFSERKRTTDQKKTVNESAVNQVSGRSGITGAKPTKECYSEEKIWEKISAMRTIVGYAEAKQSFLIDELKALYIFTGVEPPSPFVITSDLAEVNDKLQFLMSIVGIK